MEITNNSKQRINLWIIEEFKLPESAIINVSEHESGEEEYKTIQTEITVNLGEKLTNKFTILKSIDNIRKEDIERIRKTAEESLLMKWPILGHLLRFLGLWVAFSGLYAMFAVCPFCGQAGCPVGAGSAGFIGIFFAIFFQFIRNWKASLNYIYSRIFGKK